MSLAAYSSPVEIILTELQSGQRGQRQTTQVAPDTLEHIARLLKQSVTRGIVPKWTLRTEVGVTPTADQLLQIATQVEEAFISGETPVAWRIDIYN